MATIETDRASKHRRARRHMTGRPSFSRDDQLSFKTTEF